MNDWSEVDVWRKSHERGPAGALGEGWHWRAFARVRVCSHLLRLRSSVDGERIRIERPCYYAPGKWRTQKTVHLTKWFVEAKQLGLSESQTQKVIVLRDEWLDRGAPLVTRLPEIEP